MDTLLVLLIAILLIAAITMWLSRYPNYAPLSPNEPVAPEHGRAMRLPPDGRRFMTRLFILAFGVRTFIAMFLNVTGVITSLRLSPDSEKYHREGMIIAQQMATGDFNWSNWVDNGWFQFTGLIYFLFGDHPLIMQMINVTLGALTPLVVFLIAWRVFRVQRPARIVAILVAFFPSFVYWSCLMLKDPLAIFAMSLLVLSVVALRDGIKPRWLLTMAVAMCFILSVRSYLFFVVVFLIAMSYFPVDGRNRTTKLVTMGVITLGMGVVLYLAGYGFLGLDYIANSHYFDLEYINSTRVNISHGSGAFFDRSDTPLWGESWTSTLRAAAAAVYFFFVTLDFTEIDSARQLMALPEVLVILVMLPSLVRGMRYSWKNHRQAALPLALFAFGLLAVYGSATTNMGAMFRWRMQAMPFLMTFMVVGVLVSGRGLLYQLLRRVRV